MMPLLVLFDIDGTLVRPCGLGRRSLDVAFRELYGHAGIFEGVRFHGRTDADILGEGLARAGAPATDLTRVVELYLTLLEREVAGGPSLLLPGVLDLLAGLAARREVILGLVTGNVRRGAAIKLGRDGLFDRFPVGAFGDDHPDRGELVRLARRRGEELGYGPFGDGDVFYVGDTERDVEAARQGSAVAVAVATGGTALEDLRAARPDHLFTSFEPVARFLEEVLP